MDTFRHYSTDESENYSKFLENYLQVQQLTGSNTNIITTTAMKNIFHVFLHKTSTNNYKDSAMYLLGPENSGKSTILNIINLYAKKNGFKVFFMKSCKEWKSKGRGHDNYYYVNFLKDCLVENGMISTNIILSNHKHLGATWEDIIKSILTGKLEVKKGIKMITEELNALNVPKLFIFDDLEVICHDFDAETPRKTFTFYPYMEAFGIRGHKNTFYLTAAKVDEDVLRYTKTKKDQGIWMSPMDQEDYNQFLSTLSQDQQEMLKSNKFRGLADILGILSLAKQQDPTPVMTYEAQKRQEYSNIISTELSQFQNIDVLAYYTRYSEHLFGTEEAFSPNRLENVFVHGLGYQINGFYHHSNYLATQVMFEHFKEHATKVQFTEYSFRAEDLENILYASDKLTTSLVREIACCILESDIKPYQISSKSLFNNSIETKKIAIHVNNMYKSAKNLKDHFGHDMIVHPNIGITVPSLSIFINCAKIQKGMLVNEPIAYAKKHGYQIIHLSYKTKDSTHEEEMKLLNNFYGSYDNVYISFLEDFVRDHSDVVKFFEKIAGDRKEEADLEDDDDWTSPNQVDDAVNRQNFKSMEADFNIGAFLFAQNNKNKHD